jgi:hypothetical protein
VVGASTAANGEGGADTGADTSAAAAAAAAALRRVGGAGDAAADADADADASAAAAVAAVTRMAYASRAGSFLGSQARLLPTLRTAALDTPSVNKSLVTLGVAAVTNDRDSERLARTLQQQFRPMAARSGHGARTARSRQRAGGGSAAPDAMVTAGVLASAVAATAAAAPPAAPAEVPAAVPAPAAAAPGIDDEKTASRDAATPPPAAAPSGTNGATGAQPADATSTASIA